MKQTNKTMNLGYTLAQCFYWMMLCAVSAYANVYLLKKGYSNSEIGVLLSLGGVTGFFLQPMIGSLADRAKRFTLVDVILGLAGLCTLISGSLILLKERSWLMFVLYLLAIAGMQSLQPLVNALCFHLERAGHTINFGMARGMASLTYAVVSAALGYLVTVGGVYVIPATAFLMLLLLMATMSFFRASGVGVRITAGKELLHEGIDFRKHRSFLFLMIGATFLFFGHALSNVYIFQIVKNVGGNYDSMGLLTALMAVIELPTMLFFSQINRRFSCTKLLKVAAFVFTLKMFLTTYAQNVPVLVAVSMTQALGYALFTPASVRYVGELLGARHSAKGQSYLGAMLTLGNITASFMGGMFLDRLPVQQTLLIGSFVSLLGTAIVLLGMKEKA